LVTAAEACFRADLYESAVGAAAKPPSAPSDGIGAFAGPPFDANDIASHLAALKVPLHTP
jgi:NitT/TauT family transport system ATP-binding protein